MEKTDITKTLEMAPYSFKKIEEYRNLVKISDELRVSMTNNYKESGLRSKYPLKCLDQLRTGITNDYLNDKADFKPCKEELMNFKEMTYESFYKKILPPTDY